MVPLTLPSVQIATTHSQWKLPVGNLDVTVGRDAFCLGLLPVAVAKTGDEQDAGRFSWQLLPTVDDVNCMSKEGDVATVGQERASASSGGPSETSGDFSRRLAW